MFSKADDDRQIIALDWIIFGTAGFDLAIHAMHTFGL
jgi:hypothetical protein